MISAETENTIIDNKKQNPHLSLVFRCLFGRLFQLDNELGNAEK